MRNKRPQHWAVGPAQELISDITPRTDNVDSSLKIEWLNSLEAAEYLRLSVKALRNKTTNGQIPHHKLGRLNRYRKNELTALLLSKKRGQYGS